MAEPERNYTPFGEPTEIDKQLDLRTYYVLYQRPSSPPPICLPETSPDPIIPAKANTLPEMTPYNRTAVPPTPSPKPDGISRREFLLSPLELFLKRKRV